MRGDLGQKCEFMRKVIECCQSVVIMAEIVGKYG